MAKMWTEIESPRLQFEKNVTASTSIEATKFTSIDADTIASIDTRIAAINDRLQTYEDMHDHYTSPITRYMMSLTSRLLDVQRDISIINDCHCSTDHSVLQEGGSTSIDRLPKPSIEGNHLTTKPSYTAAENDQIKEDIYSAMRPMEDRLDKRCDDIYFPFNNQISGLDSQGTHADKE